LVVPGGFEPTTLAV